MAEDQAYFIQYQVARRGSKFPPHLTSQGLATVIVFADNRETACIRAGRLIAENNLEISVVNGVHLLQRINLQMFDSVLRRIYHQAELYGISFHCDFWTVHQTCCGCGNKMQNRPIR